MLVLYNSISLFMPFFFDLSSNNALTDLVNITHEITKDIQDKREAKGLAKKEIRALVVGIPNVGKSTLINRMAGRKIANVGNNPGVTKNLSWLKTNSDILLLEFISSENSLRIAYFHLFFNVTTASIMIPLINYLVVIVSYVQNVQKLLFLR